MALFSEMMDEAGAFRDEIARLRAALTEIKKLKSEPIGDTGFAVGPLALLNAAQRIAREALKPQQTPGA